jgi:hypothetical protein
MYSSLLYMHSTLRYFVLIFLLLVIVKAFMGFSGKKPFGKTDDMLGLTLFSVTHTQFLLGIILYFISSHVQFSGEAMKDPVARYWTSEHSLIMLIAVILITLARVTTRKQKDDTAKHKRMLVFNSIALLLIIMAIAMSKRGFFSLPALSN